MHEFPALLRREWLEHRTALIFPPAIVLGLIILGILVGVVFSSRIDVDIDFDGQTSHAPDFRHPSPQTRTGGLYMVHQDSTIPNNAAFRPMMVAVPMGYRDTAASKGPGIGPEDTAEHILDSDGFDHLQRYLSIPFFIVLLLVTFMLALNVTWDERKDRSILFWKSMPVSDTRAVLAKFLFLGWVTPWATVAAILIAQAIVTVVLDFYSDENLMLRLLTSGGFYSDTAFLILCALLMGFWLAPVYAWLMFVGAATPRSPMLVALFVPVILMIAEEILFDTRVTWSFVISHLAPAPLPVNAHNWSTLPSFFTELSLWIGVLVAAALLAATIWFRRRCNEV